MAKEYKVYENKRGMDLLMQEENKSSRASSSASSTAIPRKSIKVDISLRTILMILAVIAAIYFAPKLLTIVVLLFFAFIISSAVLPLVRKLVNKGMSKNLSIFLVYFVGILFFIGILTLIIAPVIKESQGLISNLQTTVDNFVKGLNSLTIFGRTIEVESLKGYLNDIVTWITKSSVATSGTDGIKSAVGALTSVAGGVISVVTILLISVYIVVDHDNFVDIVLLRIIDEGKRKRVKQLFFDVEEKLGNWLIGQFTLSFIIGFLCWLILIIAKVPFALPLAVLAALLESIPSFGPVVASIPAILTALIARGPWVGLGVLVGYAVISQLENIFIVPRLMSNAVGIKKIVVVIAVVTGFTLGGPIGALLSVPVAVLLEIFYQFYVDLQKIDAKGNV
ncbi:AI-2E family transporter [Candidatus Dojkabacteria bacterium]|jgi:predicted PurR-regulated permease PerM|nr:AI-2E family transporter [Candidatus Dojkabacteria bacterium]